MPFVHLSLACRELSDARRTRLQAGMTELMERVLRKQAQLTVVAIDQLAAPGWSVGGAPVDVDAWAGQLEVFVSAGTNSAAERGRFIAAAHALLLEQWERPPQAPLYIMVHELAADSWGYDGRTQEARRLAPAAAPATLRALAGSGSAQRPPVAGTALLLIDFQREYLDGKLPLCGLREAVRKAAQLAAAADAAGVPVIHVHHESASPAASVFAAGGPGVQPIADLPVAAHHQRIVKRLPSSFHGTPLASLLERLRVQTLVLAGCMTHNCVDSTAREALHRNYAVRIAADACATRDLPGIDGSILPAQQVHVASLSALADRHAEVLATSSLVDSWMQSVAAGACGRADVV